MVVIYTYLYHKRFILHYHRLLSLSYGVITMVKNLRKLRIHTKLTQQELADAIGVTQQSINKYENHGVEPDIYMLIKFADFFHTTVDYLIGHTPESDQIATEELELSRGEYDLIKNFRRLTGDEKKSIQLLIRKLSKK